MVLLWSVWGSLGVSLGRVGGRVKSQDPHDCGARDRRPRPNTGAEVVAVLFPDLS